MKLLEFQGKELFAKYGVPIPQGCACFSVEEVAEKAASFPGEKVVKAQVQAGKRGRGGGVRFAANDVELVHEAQGIIGSNVCGQRVECVLVEQRQKIEREMYLCVLTDTGSANGWPVILFSSAGGMDIEEIVRDHPGQLKRIEIDPAFGVHDFQLRELVTETGLDKNQNSKLAKIARAIYQLYWENDCELVEMNPLILTQDGELVAIDAKITIDSSARYRHPDIQPIAEGTVEELAATRGLAFVELDGNIGVISNGAGLTMATLDHIALLGGRPANFLDTGERILGEGIPDAIDILLQYPSLKVILINVFGGGVRCDVIAEKIVEAVIARPGLRVPVVVYLRGRNEDLGRKRIADDGLPSLRLAFNIFDALTLAVQLGAEP